MNPLTPSNSRAACPQECHARWTPPPWLLELVSGDDSLIVELIDVFKTATETDLQQMRAALAAGDVQKLRANAHRVKGSAKQVGAEALAEVCQELELASNLTPVSRLGELVGRCQELFGETGSAMTWYSNDSHAAETTCAAIEPA